MIKKTVLLLFLPLLLSAATVDKELLEAIKKNDPQGVEKALRSGANPNYVVLQGEDRGITPLMVAVYGKNLRIIQSLLEAGSDPNYTLAEGKYKGFSVLLFALSTQNQEIIQLIINAGANVNHILSDKQLNGISMLMLAIKSKQLQATKSLLAKGAKVNYQVPKESNSPALREKTALDFAYETKNQDMIDLVLKAGGKKGRELSSGSSVQSQDSWYDL
ncbi:MAG: ankyrin repeat domain-containing protein [Spirochaetota bacterium]